MRNYTVTLKYSVTLKSCISRAMPGPRTPTLAVQAHTARIAKLIAEVGSEVQL